MSLDRQILSFLLEVDDKRSIPEIAKAVKQANSTVEYRVKKLVEKGIVVEKNPASSGTIRKYGHTYHLNPEFKPQFTKSLALGLVFVGFFIMGLILLPSDPLFASFWLLPSSMWGAAATFLKYRQLYTRSLQRMLAEIS